MIHGWNGPTVEAKEQLEKAVQQHMREKGPIFGPGYETIETEPKEDRPFLYRRTEAEGCRVVELGDQFLSAIRLFVIALIFCLTFSAVWKAIETHERTEAVEVER